MRRPRLSIRRVGAVAIAVALPVTLASCNDDKGGDSARFCELVRDNAAALLAVPQTEAGVDDYIALYREVGDVAPLAIEQDWTALTLSFETAWTGDDQQEAIARAYATERSAVAVATWLKDNCGIDFGPVATIVQPVTTTTTVPGTSAPG